MTDITTQIANFFVSSGAAPATSANNTVTPLVDGSNYFGALRIEVNNLKTSPKKGKFFYFTNWLLALTDVAPDTTVAAGGFPSAWSANLPTLTAFKLDDKKGPTYPNFIDELTTMAAALIHHLSGAVRLAVKNRMLITT